MTKKRKWIMWAIILIGVVMISGCVQESDYEYVGKIIDFDVSAGGLGTDKCKITLDTNISRSLLGRDCCGHSLETEKCLYMIGSLCSIRECA